MAPFRGVGVTAVCGIESRGFLLGGAAALALGAGFAAVRKGDGLFPGAKLTVRTRPDYRGLRHELRMRRSALGPGDVVLFVDDWIGTGGQALAVRELVAATGAPFVGCAAVVDEVRPAAREALGT
ncbi:phosphoribosyltransferase family protein [Streptomyces sp. MP131-18]|uniref:phosphoribosyltransferase family protein n=1 Tax=Streptomyces sp. MP131-18 TaxID=1857892 RepID=UPI0009C76382|nr:phosphoribosyltransferase family protein [Streptomyces sp. MP131-18]ONK12426.1 Adenine phosphoribosyltransferase [Streptomyces sp. MP131-18]